eukprot:g10765.t2
MSPDLREDIHEELGVALVACSLKGWRKSQEDTSAIVINLGGHKDMLGVGVFDGHSGQEASKYVAENLWNQVVATSQWAANDIEGALKAAFLAVDASMQREKVCHGTTAVVAVVTPGNLYVANCGDSRAVLCKEGVATAMSNDHKPCVYTERDRVIRCGGQIISGEFGGVSRVTYPGCRVAMATSRSLGDFHFKRNYNSSPSEQVISPAPEVMCVPRSPQDEFLILGTDGVWDVLSNQEVSDMMRASNRARRPGAEAPPAPPPATLWEDSSAKASASASASASAKARGDETTGEGATSRGINLGDAVVEAGEGTQNGGASLQSTRRINGFGPPPAAPSTPFHPPITPHHKVKASAPFDVPASTLAADADSYESSDCGSSSSDSGSSDAEEETTSHVGMDIDGKDGGGGRKKSKSRPPAFVRLFTPTLLRLKTPTPPNPVVRAPQRRPAAAVAAGTGTGTGTGTTTASVVEAGEGGEGTSAAVVNAGGGGSGSSGGSGIGGSCAEESRGFGADSGGSAEVVGGSGGAPGLKKASCSSSSEDVVCGGENAGEADSGAEDAAAVPGAGPTVEERAGATTAATAAAAEHPAVKPVAQPIAEEGDGEEGRDQTRVQDKSSETERGITVAPEAVATPPASAATIAAAAAEAADNARDNRDGAREGSSAAAGSSGTENVHVVVGNGQPVSAEEPPPHACATSETAVALDATTAPMATGGDKAIPAGEAGPVGSSPPPEKSGGGRVVGAVHGNPSGVSNSGGGNGGSWSTTTPPKTPVNGFNLPTGGDNVGTKNPTIPEAKTEAPQPPQPPPPPAAPVGAPASATATPPGSERTGTVTIAATGDSNAAPTAAARAGNGVAPSARTPGGGGGSGGIGATPNRPTPASSRTPGGGGGGGSASTSVSHTPSRKPSMSRAATPTRRISSYRRSSGSGLSLGLFKSSGSLSVSMSGKGDRSAVGAVQGVLDKALVKGSQDNMTLIAIDLRGLLDASPPDSASSTHL